MKLATLFGVTLLSLAAGAPSSDDRIIIDSDFFPDDLAIYTSKHDIVSLTVPLNGANFVDDEDSNDDDGDSNIFLIFVEADINDKGEYDYKGMYRFENGTATKILETGTDSAADNTESKNVYLSATDGLYVYNAATKEVHKYSSITNSLIGITKLNFTDELFVLSADHDVYKVSQNGEKVIKMDDLHGARQIVLDFSDNLYYYGEDKQPYVVSEDGVKKIEGLPPNPKSVSFVKPPFVIEDGVLFVSDEKSYVIYANGTSELNDFVLQVKPTVCTLEGTLIEYCAYNKKLYEYNILALLVGTLMEELKKFLDDKTVDIQNIATRSRGNLKA